MTFSLALTQSPQHSYYNGGTTAVARQYYLRPTQHTPNGPRIAAAVAGMVPGEFRTIWADGNDSIFRVFLASSGAIYNTLDWNPRGVWDAGTEQIILGGKRGSYKTIAYSDITGDWRALPMHPDMGRVTYGTAHWYGMTSRGLPGKPYLGLVGVRTFEFDPATETYVRITDHASVGSGDDGSCLAWSSTAYGGAGGLLKYSGGVKRWLSYNPATNAWTNHADGLLHGMHAIIEHHPVAGVTLMVGGTDTAAKASLVTDAGVATPVTDCPQPISMASGSWVVAHPAGCWLVRGYVAGSSRLYACWPNAAKTDVVWQDLGVAPDNGLTYSTAAVDYDRGMIYIVSTTGLHAYKLPEVTDPSATIHPSSGRAQITGHAPTLAHPQTIAPASGAIQARGYAPTVLLGNAQLVEPVAGRLFVSGNAPSLSQPITLSPAAGHAQAQGYAPTVTQYATVAPSAGRVLATGHAPAIAQPRAITPQPGRAQLAGHAPIVVQGVEIVVAPLAGQVQARGYAPAVEQGGAVMLTPAAGRVRAMGWAPSVTTMPIGGYPSSVTITVPAGWLMSASGGRTITLRPR